MPKLKQLGLILAGMVIMGIFLYGYSQHKKINRLIETQIQIVNALNKPMAQPKK